MPLSARPFTIADASAKLDDAAFVVLGVPFDATASFRSGARQGPNAIREASWNFETYMFQHDVDLVDVPVHDAGNIEDVATIEGMGGMVEEAVGHITGKGAFPILLGGEHSVTPPAVRAMARRHGRLAVVTIDAHLDFRDEYLDVPGSHACAARRMADAVGVAGVVPLGVRSIFKEEKDDADRLGLRYIDAFSFRRMGAAKAVAQALRWLGKRPIYLTIDIDGIDPAYAPATGTPEPFGLTPDDVKTVIDLLAPSLVGFDIVEVCPPYDRGNTAALAARLVRETVAVVWKDHRKRAKS